MGWNRWLLAHAWLVTSCFVTDGHLMRPCRGDTVVLCIGIHCAVWLALYVIEWTAEWLMLCKNVYIHACEALGVQAKLFADELRAYQCKANHIMSSETRWWALSALSTSKQQQEMLNCCKRLYFWQRQRSRREPALVLKLDYMRKWIYAEELSPRSHARSTCRGFLMKTKAKRDESCTGEQNTSKRILRSYRKPTKYRNKMRQSEDESSWEP